MRPARKRTHPDVRLCCIRQAPVPCTVRSYGTVIVKNGLGCCRSFLRVLRTTVQGLVNLTEPASRLVFEGLGKRVHRVVSVEWTLHDVRISGSEVLHPKPPTERGEDE